MASQTMAPDTPLDTLLVPHAPHGGLFARRPEGPRHAVAHDAQQLQRFWAYPNAPERSTLLMVLQRHQVVTPHQLHRLFPVGYKTLPALLTKYGWGTRLTWSDGTNPDPRVALWNPFYAAAGLSSVMRGTVPNGRFLLHRVMPVDRLFAWLWVNEWAASAVTAPGHPMIDEWDWLPALAEGLPSPVCRVTWRTQHGPWGMLVQPVFQGTDLAPLAQAARLWVSWLDGQETPHLLWFLVADATALAMLRAALLDARVPLHRIAVSAERQVVKPIGLRGSFCLLTENPDAPWTFGSFRAFEAPAE
ncbi:MAG: hypothetical protein M1272_01005 [Firmicutes bacterium]|nr:hypothetical protein [Bacillota bacterium]